MRLLILFYFCFWSKGEWAFTQEMQKQTGVLERERWVGGWNNCGSQSKKSQSHITGQNRPHFTRIESLPSNTGDRSTCSEPTHPNKNWATGCCQLSKLCLRQLLQMEMDQNIWQDGPTSTPRVAMLWTLDSSTAEGDQRRPGGDDGCRGRKRTSCGAGAC